MTYCSLNTTLLHLLNGYSCCSIQKWNTAKHFFLIPHILSYLKLLIRSLDQSMPHCRLLHTFKTKASDKNNMRNHNKHSVFKINFIHHCNKPDKIKKWHSKLFLDNINKRHMGLIDQLSNKIQGTIMFLKYEISVMSFYVKHWHFGLMTCCKLFKDLI